MFLRDQTENQQANLARYSTIVSHRKWPVLARRYRDYSPESLKAIYDEANLKVAWRSARKSGESKNYLLNRLRPYNANLGIASLSRLPFLCHSLVINCS